ncbi:phosphate ABC transporter substrate-binding protein [Thermodesulfobacteriota bacterium]
MWMGLFLVLAVVFVVEATSFAGELDRFRGVKGTLKIAGGTALLPVMTEAALRIHAVSSDIHIKVTGGGGTSCGILKVGEGLVDIGNCGRALSDAEREQYRLISRPLALDGIAVAVHVANPVSELSVEQVKKIFSGQIDNWQALGGTDAPIVRYGRKQGSATREIFEKKMLGQRGAAECNIVSSNSTMRNILAMDRDGIGYLSIGYIQPAKVKGITIDGVIPSQQNARNGKYGVTRTLYMATGENPSELAILFHEYLQSREGMEIIKESGYIPLR